MSALDELLDAIVALRCRYDLGPAQVDELTLAALAARYAHPGLECGADLLGQLGEVSGIGEHHRTWLLDELHAHHEHLDATRARVDAEVVDAPPVILHRTVGHVVGWLDDDHSADDAQQLRQRWLADQQAEVR